MTRDEIYRQLCDYLENIFEVPAAKITPEAKLFEDLDLDSVDAVDLVVKLQELTGRKIRPDQFKTVRTVGDVVDRVHDLFTENA